MSVIKRVFMLLNGYETYNVAMIYIYMLYDIVTHVDMLMQLCHGWRHL